MQDKLKDIVIALVVIAIVMGLALTAKNLLVEKMTEYQTFGYSINLNK